VAIHVMPDGDVVSVPISVPEIGLSSRNSTLASPLPPGSDAFAETAMGPDTTVPTAGAVIETLGG
jgi:hypothetical protein